MLHLFTALNCEATPLIDHLHLKEQKPHDLFRLFTDTNNETSLIITGVGKTACAAAVSYHHACVQTSATDIWLNIGVAGHQDLAAGDPCLVNKITDAGSGESWYPQIVFTPPCRAMPLITLEQPSADYQPLLYDMEAAGFYAIASRLGTSELIHCFKVVSDNALSDSFSVNARTVKSYINNCIGTIDELIDNLRGLSSELQTTVAKPHEFETIVNHWHFTQTQQHQLLQLLRRWTLLGNEEDVSKVVADADTARSVIQRLTSELDSKHYNPGNTYRSQS